ncbi:porphobilinogen deaminase [mine drainage metagenome]|uniref:hydroxymethylbilane synthase n=1 Tax=mine drainage metagenome TaxID=410659 RepID=A0A1J5S742_9ZZZZ
MRNGGREQDVSCYQPVVPVDAPCRELAHAYCAGANFRHAMTCCHCYDFPMNPAATIPSSAPPSIPPRLVIATRESRLAMWQAEHVQALLQALHPSSRVCLDGMTTRGDQILDKTLAKVGGKGLFVKELELALESGEADLAVHSLKDVPMVLPAGFALPVIMQREDPRDAWVSERAPHFTALPPGAVVGTSSLRREMQIRALRPDLRVTPLRGNLDTRLRKLDAGQYDGIVLAAAGLKRLGLEARIRALIDPAELLPAVGQAALGIEIRADRADMAVMLAPLDHAPTHLCALAERSVARALGGGCSTPLGAHAQWSGQTLELRALLGLPDGSRMLRAEVAATVATSAQADALGLEAARQLREQGAQALLDQLEAS